MSTGATLLGPALLTDEDQRGHILPADLEGGSHGAQAARCKSSVRHRLPTGVTRINPSAVHRLMTSSLAQSPQSQKYRVVGRQTGKPSACPCSLLAEEHSSSRRRSTPPRRYGILLVQFGLTHFTLMLLCSDLFVLCTVNLRRFPHFSAAY